MTDQFQLREDAGVAWLAFKRELGHLITKENEEVLRLTFTKGFSDGWGKGIVASMDATMKIIEKIA